MFSRIGLLFTLSSFLAFVWGSWNNWVAYSDGKHGGVIFSMLVVARIGIIIFALEKLRIEFTREEADYVNCAVWIGVMFGGAYLSNYLVPILEAIGSLLNIITKQSDQALETLRAI